MFKEIIGKLDTYFSTSKKLDELHKMKLAELQRNFGNGDLYKQRADADTRELEKTKQASLENLKKEIEKTFADFEKEINEYISAPLPADFVTTMNTLQANGVILTKSEAEALLYKYPDNYLVRRTLAGALGDLDALGFDRTILADDMASVRGIIDKVLQNATVNGDPTYWQLAITMDTAGNPLNDLEARYNDFETNVKAGKPSLLTSKATKVELMPNYRVNANSILN